MSLFTDILFSIGPVILFVVLMAVVYFRGSRLNKKIEAELEEKIEKSLEPFVKKIDKVKLRPDEFEYRCQAKNKEISIFTLHLKMVNRSFIIQWLVNLVFKEKERIFIGIKLGGDYGDNDPPYRFDVAPYHKKKFIRQRFETFVEFDDIATASKKIDRRFMIKSEDRAYVMHLVENKEFLRLLSKNEEYLEYIGVHKAKEETDPHVSITFEFRAQESQPVEEMIRMFFVVVNQHLQNQDNVRKVIAKGAQAKAKARKSGKAKRGGAKRKKTAKKN